MIQQHKVKFHYAIQVADLVADLVSDLAFDKLVQVCDQLATFFGSNAGRHVETARTCLRQVRNQICHQVCDLYSV